MSRRWLPFLALVVLAWPQWSVAAAPDWNKKLDEAMPLLGHRNWILVVDSAYPLQTAAGIETIETNASQTEVLRAAFTAIEHSIHVRPVVFMDAELPYVSDADAPGASAYRAQVGELLRGYPLESMRHEKIISQIDEAGKTFHILVLKTTMTIPYTSVFIRLDCKYWSDEQERSLRSKMKSHE